jgi:hypothetical protein
LNNIPHFILHLLLRTLKALPQIIADAASLQQQGQSLFLVSDRHDALNILAGPTQECGFEDRLGHSGCFFLFSA